jgi:tRNA pseudouridine38-40 synthase
MFFSLSIYGILQIADPVVYGETEWISVLFHGQSFMLHQVFVQAIQCI